MKTFKGYAWLTALTLIQGSVVTPRAFARTDDTYDPNTYDSSRFEAEEADCDRVCDEFADAKVDPQWCADHGEVTSSSILSDTKFAEVPPTAGQRVVKKDGMLQYEAANCPYPLIGP